LRVFLRLPFDPFGKLPSTGSGSIDTASKLTTFDGEVSVFA